jgi:hypothetical protein
MDREVYMEQEKIYFWGSKRQKKSFIAQKRNSRSKISKPCRNRLIFDYEMNFLKPHVLWKKLVLTTITTTTKRKSSILKWIKLFFVKIHYIFKYGLILKKFLLKCQAKLEFFRNGQYKNSSRQIPVIPWKNEFHNSHFSYPPPLLP